MHQVQKAPGFKEVTSYVYMLDNTLNLLLFHIIPSATHPVIPFKIFVNNLCVVERKCRTVIYFYFIFLFWFANNNKNCRSHHLCLMWPVPDMVSFDFSLLLCFALLLVCFCFVFLGLFSRLLIIEDNVNVEIVGPRSRKKVLLECIERLN